MSLSMLTSSGIVPVYERRPRSSCSSRRTSLHSSRLGSLRVSKHSCQTRPNSAAGGPGLTRGNSLDSSIDSADTDAASFHNVGYELLDVHDNGTLTVPQPFDPVAELLCPFQILDCEEVFSEVIAFKTHVFTHFRGHGPPTVADCFLCDDRFEQSEGDYPALAWNNMLSHLVNYHFRRGQRLSTVRTNFALMRWMFSKKIIGAEQFKRTQLSAVPAVLPSRPTFDIQQSSRSTQVPPTPAHPVQSGMGGFVLQGNRAVETPHQNPEGLESVLVPPVSEILVQGSPPRVVNTFQIDLDARSLSSVEPDPLPVEQIGQALHTIPSPIIVAQDVNISERPLNPSNESPGLKLPIEIANDSNATRANSKIWWSVANQLQRTHYSRAILLTYDESRAASRFEIFKRSLEERIHGTIAWWPFASAVQKCLLDQTRISWSCSCGASFNVCISSTHVESFCQQIGLATHAPNELPLLPIHQEPVSSLPSAPVQATQGTNAQSSRGQRATPSRNPPTPILSTQQAGALFGGGGATTNNKFIYWCVDIQRAVTKYTELDTNTLNDANLVPSLLASYKNVLGMRSWLTLTGCASVRFIKFRKLFKTANYVTPLSDSLPCRRTNQEYEYQYCDPDTPESDFTKWLQAIIAVRIAYPRCPETLRLGSALEYVPKKINGRLSERLDGYGMYAVSAYCLWKAVLAVVVAAVGPLIFMGRWLAGHQGDWQNALAMLGVTFSLLNILVVQYDRWSFAAS